MRLTQINLAGFKSFVDPTKIPTPGQLVGIVGPNGCGKSNIIDAVRWVLGETSAKHLRGETMQDVLFNGSGQRKPVNRCSVELVFDNSLGKAAGQWSQYAEVSIKRVLQRDGDSSYYINNQHVRRRDIADIFLGTGLGARAYAIIEQGMISRVIEAKPEELRVFLEEAAGVSKYRERRRETELRLKDTRENLSRVEDIRQELDKQLVHLAEQAEVARKYHELQAELSTTQGLMWLTKRNEAASARARHGREIERLGVELEAETARLREAENRLETLRDEHYKASDTMHAAQGALYESNAEVARLEREIEHVRENRARVEHQVGTLRSQLAAAEGQLAAAQANLEDWRGQSAETEERAAAAEETLTAERDKLPLAEEAYRASNLRREELQRAVAQAEQALHVERTKLDHAARVLDQLTSREQRLREEQAALPAADEAALERIAEEARELEESLQSLRAQLADKEAELPSLEAELRSRTEALDAASQRLTGVEARVQALRQLQDRIARGAELQGWLESRQLDSAPRLWQGIAIEPGWEDALESVLRERLNGIVLESVGRAVEWSSDTPPGKMTVIEGSAADEVRGSIDPSGLAPLARYVTCRDPKLEAVVREWLHEVYVPEQDLDAEGTLALRSRLPAGAVLVTREGHVYTRHSVSFHAPDSELHGVLSRQREIEDLERELDREREAQSAAQDDVGIAEGAIEQHRSEVAELRESATEAQSRHHAMQMEAVRMNAEAQRLMQRAEQIAEELAEITEQIENETAAREEAAAHSAELEAQGAHAREELEAALDLYQRAESVLRLQREELQRAQAAHQEAQYQARSAQARVTEIENQIGALTAQTGQLAETIAREEEALATLDETQWQEQLQSSLLTRGEREQALAQARDALEGFETQVKDLEQERLSAEQRLGPLRDRINDVRLKEQEARLTEEQYAQQLAEAGANEEELTNALEKGTRSRALIEEIARLNEEIKALGAVNLAALEELQTSTERKQYLDAQSADLTEALTTLEDAIRRIDRETRERLQQTFDDVNEHFSKMFPALFGGGNAKLVLTGEEILDGGVQVIAQPPGKKNSSIHLLSGGEKALTALSLVFSIFQLNPAPFCLLDEVDAPLDDYNTQRYVDLVAKMSATSQFLFISHNKITMEMANQLLGITMQEPGVSRVVAVDIEEAMKLTEEAAA
ncbi:MAG TPA: chromosome segregation protein SMC [Burkholderiales bacterium]|nr:chromosome segregation protein SMC [Burkholderiales bacterium]